MPALLSSPRPRASFLHIVRRLGRHLLTAALLVLAGSQPAQAIVFWEEVTLYLTHGNFRPGHAVETAFYFGTKPAFELSSFDFTLTWDSPLVSPAETGPGSVAEWVSTLSSKGSASFAPAGPQALQGHWVADSLGGSASLISTSYDYLHWASFRFETSAALDQPFVISFELTNLKDASGEPIDLGSGFINWATMTPVPVPEPVSGLQWLAGVLGCAWAARRRLGIARPG